MKLPIQLALGTTGPRQQARIRGASDASGGWTVLECADLAEAHRIMRDYPSARMPCWARFEQKL